MISRAVAALPLDVRKTQGVRDRPTWCATKGPFRRPGDGSTLPGDIVIDALAADRGVESLLGQDGELGEPRTALGVVSGRHSRMLQRQSRPHGLGSVCAEFQSVIVCRHSGRRASVTSVVMQSAATATRRPSVAS